MINIRAIGFPQEAFQEDVLASLLGEGERNGIGIEERLSQGESFEKLLREQADVHRGTPEGEGLALILQAGLYYRQGLLEEALQACTDARNALQAWPQAQAAVGALEANTLTALRRYDDAFVAFKEREQATLERHARWEGKSPLASLAHEMEQRFYQNWALVGIAQSLEGLAGSNLAVFEAGGEKVIAILNSPLGVGQESAVWEAVDRVEAGLPPEQRPLVEELRMYVRLGLIDDPFERWEALGEEISKVWPKGVSAIDAIWEQRK